MFIAILFLIRANIENGMNDDWSFIRTAMDLAHTGHLRYNGWSSPLIGFQAYWGALFIKLFGFSYTAVRASTWVLTLISIPVLWSLLRNAGANQEAAFFGTISFLFSPLVLPNATTFMTDIPAFLLFAGALLSALKAWKANTDRAAILWTVAVTILGLLSGSVRQIYWVSGMSFLPVLGWKRFRSLRGRLFIAGCMLVTVILAVSASHWLGRQPYVPADTILDNLHDLSWQDIISNSSGDVSRDLLGVMVLSIPFSLLLALDEGRRLPIWVWVIIVLAAFGITAALSQPMPWLGNTITQYGVLSPHTVIYGEKPRILSKNLIRLLGTLGLTTFTLAACALIRMLRIRTPRKGNLTRFAMLTIPFLLAYLGALAFRATSFGLFDRYMIPVLFICTVVTVAAAPRLTSASIGIAIVFGLYALATTHDYFAEARAKLEAVKEVVQAGHPRNSISGGFEFDAWTQTELAGFVNNEAIDNPPDAYRETDDCNGASDVQLFWREYTPDIKASYLLSLTPLNELKPSEFSPVSFQRWLPPGTYFVYVEKVDPPLSCPQKLN